MLLLLAEDEEAMADAIVGYLSYHKMTVDWASDGLAAMDAALQKNYDVMILDIMMPGMDGITLLRRLRATGNTAPALFLTAKSELRDKVHGFEAGSDDYLTKPFAMEELLVRVNALARRGKPFHGECMSLADLMLDKSAVMLRVGEKSCPLSHREYQLIEHFMRHPRMFFSADQLLDNVWGMDAFFDQGTVWAHISYLRKKLEMLDAHVVIRSKRGIGYALEEIK